MISAYRSSGSSNFVRLARANEFLERVNWQASIAQDANLGRSLLLHLGARPVRRCPPPDLRRPAICSTRLEFEACREQRQLDATKRDVVQPPRRPIPTILMAARLNRIPRSDGRSSNPSLTRLSRRARRLSARRYVAVPHRTRLSWPLPRDCWNSWDRCAPEIRDKRIELEPFAFCEA